MDSRNLLLFKSYFINSSFHWEVEIQIGIKFCFVSHIILLESLKLQSFQKYDTFGKNETQNFAEIPKNSAGHRSKNNFGRSG